MAEPQLSPEEPAIQTVEKIPAEILSETTLEKQVLSVGSPLRELPQPITTIPTLNALPIELLTAIFKYLVAPAPSASKLNDEPIYEVTQSKEANLKAVSLVSKRCRKASVPFLFHHVRLTLSEFWRDHPGRQKIGSFETTQFLEFFSEPDLSQLVQTLTILVPAVPYLPEHAHRQPQNYPLDADFFWKSIFDKIDPVELLIVAPVQAMGCLTTCYIESGDMKWYDSPFHYLRLRQPPLDKSKGKQKFIGNYDELEPTPDPETSTIEADDFGSPTPDPDISVPVPDDWEHSPRVAANYSALFEIRPWSSILLNEGSFIKVFSSPIGQTHCAPSMLVDLVGCPEDFFAEPGRPLISPTIRSFEYIAIFPPIDHFNKLCEYMPRIDNFYMQLVPRNDILDDEDKLQNVEIDELWQNRNQCYACVLRELFNMPPTGNYRYLREFESGDIADTDAWHMAVEFVKRVGSSLGWKVERDGVFVRNVQKSAGAETEAEPESSLSVTN